MQNRLCVCEPRLSDERVCPCAKLFLHQALCCPSNVQDSRWLFTPCTRPIDDARDTDPKIAHGERALQCHTRVPIFYVAPTEGWTEVPGVNVFGHLRSYNALHSPSALARALAIRSRHLTTKLFTLTRASVVDCLAVCRSAKTLCDHFNSVAEHVTKLLRKCMYSRGQRPFLVIYD